MPGLDAKETKSLFKRIADSGQSVNYAIGLGASPETSGFIVHKSKKVSALEGEMKKDGKYKKVGFGSLEVRGGEVALTERRQVAHADKLLRRLFKANGLKAFEPIIVDAVPGDAAAPGDAAGGGGAEAAARRAERLDRMADMRADLAELLARLGR